MKSDCPHHLLAWQSFQTKGNHSYLFKGGACLDLTRLCLHFVYVCQLVQHLSSKDSLNKCQVSKTLVRRGGRSQYSFFRQKGLLYLNICSYHPESITEVHLCFPVAKRQNQFRLTVLMHQHYRHQCSRQLRASSSLHTSTRCFMIPAPLLRLSVVKIFSYTV